MSIMFFFKDLISIRATRMILDDDLGKYAIDHYETTPLITKATRSGY